MPEPRAFFLSLVGKPPSQELPLDCVLKHEDDDFLPWLTDYAIEVAPGIRVALMWTGQTILPSGAVGAGAKITVWAGQAGDDLDWIDEAVALVAGAEEEEAALRELLAGAGYRVPGPAEHRIALRELEPAMRTELLPQGDDMPVITTCAVCGGPVPCPSGHNAVTTREEAIPETRGGQSLREIVTAEPPEPGPADEAKKPADKS